MCGICGVVHSAPTEPISEERLLAMRDSMRHRGPDDAGHHLEPGIALGSRRLAILDLSQRGHMPMGTADGRYRIVYNGEVYNYRDLRPTLESRGYSFQSNTDTEVLLNLYAEHGPAMLDQLNGMFALAIWDARERTLFLARDRLGVKPLYYARRGDALHFASEAKALLAAGIPAAFDEECWEELLCHGYVAGERTPLLGVECLLPGHYLLWQDGSYRIRRWWNLAERAQARREELPPDPVRWFRETFDDAVRLRRISDVPVGVLLSGGLDSSSVAASLSLQSGGSGPSASGVASFTMRFAEPRFDEGPLARQVAERWSLDHRELSVPSDQLWQRVRRAASLLDEPLAHGSDLHALAIAEYARSWVTVLLSGEGGDETLGGYVRYLPLRFPGVLKAAQPWLPRLAAALGLEGKLGKLGRFLEMGSLDRLLLFSGCHAFPRDLRAVGMSPSARFPFRERVLAEAQTVYPREPARQAMYSDQHTYLPSLLTRNDRMTMGASIECRLPFLDYRLVEGAAALPSSLLFAGRQGKRILRQALGSRLPEEVLTHRKMGFSAPWARYLREAPEFRERIAELPSLDPVARGPFDPALLRRVIGEFQRGDSRYEFLIRQLLMIQIWHEVCVSAPAPPPPERAAAAPSFAGR